MPNTLAKGLLQLARISSTQLESCAFSGGIDCAWLAAFAEFAFGLSIDIKRPNGDYLYRSESGRRINGGEAQVIVFGGREPRSSIELARLSFILPSGKSLLQSVDRPLETGSNFLTRSPWTSILGDSFSLLQDIY